MKDKKIIITGGSGGIGKQLANRLVLNGYSKVLVLDKTIKPGLDTRVGTLEVDLTDELKSKKYFEVADYIFHLACIKPSERITTKEEYWKNIQMTQNVARFNKKAQIIYSSAGTIYGSQAIFPIKEMTEIVCGRNDHYCCGKLDSEHILEQESKIKGWPLTILRITNVYGPQFKRKGEILPVFFKNIIQEQPLLIHGDGTQKRDRIHIHDLTRAFILSMDRVGTFNIGSEKSYSTLEVAELMGKILRKNYRLEFHDEFQIRRKDNLFDITKAKSILGFQPKVGFKKGLKQTVNVWKENGIS